MIAFGRTDGVKSTHSTRFARSGLILSRVEVSRLGRIAPKKETLVKFGFGILGPKEKLNTVNTVMCPKIEINIVFLKRHGKIILNIKYGFLDIPVNLFIYPRESALLLVCSDIYLSYA